MTTYSDRFGNEPVSPSNLSYKSLIVSATPYQFTWLDFNNSDTTGLAVLTEVTTASTAYTLKLPPADEVSTGTAVILSNVGANSFFVVDYDGNSVALVDSSEIKYIYLKDNSSQAGVWTAFAFGAGTSQADASALAGPGLAAISGLLNQTMPISTKNSNYALTANDRAQAIVWTGGTGTFTLDSIGNLTNGWFVGVKNFGTGTLTVSGSSNIDGNASLTLNQNEAAVILAGSSDFLLISRFREATNVFDVLSKSVTGSSNVTLTTAESNYEALIFTGVLTGNINIIFPATGRWYIYNNTSGAFTLTCKTAFGTGVTITQGTRQIINGDGTNIVKSIDSGTGTVTSIGTGTGLTGGPITSSGTVALANTAVTPGVYGAADKVGMFSVDAQGRLISAADTNILLSTANISDNQVTNAKLAQVPTATFKARLTAGTGNSEDLTSTQARGVLDVYSKSEVDSEIAAEIAALPFTQAYQSAEQTITSGGTLTLAHGLSSEPTLLQAYIICKTAEFSFSIGDKICLSGFYTTSTTATSNCVQMIPDPTNVVCKIGDFFSVFDKTTPTVRRNITYDRWRLIIRAWA